MSVHVSDRRDARRAGAEACPYEWLFCLSVHVSDRRDVRWAGTETCPYDWLSNSVNQAVFKYPPSHTRAPVFQLQVNTGAAAEDIQGWAVGDVNQAAGADLVVPLFRAEAQCLEGLTCARQLDR